MKYQSKCVAQVSFNSKSSTPPVEFTQLHTAFEEGSDYMVSQISMSSFVSKKGEEWFTFKYEVYK